MPKSIQGLLRPTISIVAAIAALLLVLVAISAPGRAEAAQCRGGDAHPRQLDRKQAEKAVTCLLNKKRRNHGLEPLDQQSQQMEAAKGHTKRMVRHGCFSHQCLGEPDLAGRLTKAKYLPCGCSWGVAENIAYGKDGQGSPRSIVKSWMNSSEHRVNILNGSYRHIGVGVVWGTPGGGKARNSATYTADFGFKH